MSTAGKQIFKNADNEYLGPWGASGLIIGCVDEVNGYGAEEIQDFAPTRHELIQLVKYWAKEVLDIRWFYFCTGQTGSSEIRMEHFANRRVNRIASLLGEAEVNTVVDEVYDRFREKQDEKLWDIFVNGDEAQWRAVQEETQQRLD